MTVPRVLMQGGPTQRSALKVSLPGFNVNTATLNQLAFDAEGACFRILARGFVDNICPPGNAEGVSQAQVNFTAQSRPPFLACHWRFIGAGGVLDPIAAAPFMTITAANVFEYARVIINTNNAVFWFQHHSFQSYRCYYIVFIEV